MMYVLCIWYMCNVYVSIWSDHKQLMRSPVRVIISFFLSRQFQLRGANCRIAGYWMWIFLYTVINTILDFTMIYRRDLYIEKLLVWYFVNHNFFSQDISGDCFSYHLCEGIINKKYLLGKAGGEGGRAGSRVNFDGFP